jgi:UDP-N-acetylglucosamine 2-epimerase (non-hydrolysing)
MKVLHVVAARPNFMKVAPIMLEMRRFPDRFEQLLVHTGQHYDPGMSQVFFDDLGIPRPDIDLGVGSGTHSEQVARVLLAFEPVLMERRPDLVLVVGDVNSTFACALAAVRLGIPVAHVEAGLRSFDRTMPEEINRILTDQISDLLFTTERGARDNLLREGIAEEKIRFVGNVMIDTLLRQKSKALSLGVAPRFGLTDGGYALVTLHRPSNVDEPEALRGIVRALAEVQERLPVLFPAHPRTVRRLREFDLESEVSALPQLQVVPPLGYLEFLNLMANARVVLTDSGGIQEETTILGVPCLTLRANTERPITITEGTNRLIGTDPAGIAPAVREVLAGSGRDGRRPELWDGEAAGRIVRVLLERA